MYFYKFLVTNMLSNILVGAPSVAFVIYKIEIIKIILKEHSHFVPEMAMF